MIWGNSVHASYVSCLRESFLIRPNTPALAKLQFNESQLLFHEMPSRKEMLRRRWVFAAPLAAESAGRRLDAGRRHIESPGENQSDRKADEQQDDGQAQAPAAIT